MSTTIDGRVVGSVLIISIKITNVVVNPVIITILNIYVTKIKLLFRANRLITLRNVVDARLHPVQCWSAVFELSY